MNRTGLFSLLLGMPLAFVLCFTTVAAQQDKKEKKEDPKGILGKSIAEWIRLLREDKNPKQRQLALLVLEAGDAASRAALDPILETVEKDPDPQVRREAVRVVGRLNPETRGAFKALLTALQTDKDGIVREAAAVAIGKKFVKSAEEYVPALVEALKDPHAGTRLEVATALRNLDKHAKPAVPALIEAARNPKEDKHVRSVAIHVISRQ